MQAVPVRPPRRAASWLLAAATLFGASPALAQTDPTSLPYDPQRHVVVAPDAALPSAEGLAERLRRLEHESSALRFVVVAVRDAGPSPLRGLLALRDRWEQHPGFERDRTFLVLVATERPRDHVEVLVPAVLADRLGLTLRAVERLVAVRWRPRASTAGALLDLVASLEGAFRELEQKALGESERRRSVRQELERQVTGDVDLVSARLTELELHCAELRAEGLGVGAAEDRLDELRRGLADALDEHAQAPEQLVATLAATKLAVAEVEAAVATLERLRREGALRLARGRTDLEATGLVVDQRGAAAPPAARDARARATAALGEAEAALGRGDPTAAAAHLDQADADLGRARAALEAPAPAARSPLDLLAVLGALAGVVVVAVGAGLVRQALRRAAARERLAGLRGAARGLVDALEQELVGLRTRYLRASRPGPIAVPAALGPSRPPARELAGESAQHLARARAAIDDLHRTLRQARHALAHSAALEAAGAPPEQALLPLERAPAGRLPARAIRETAQHLEKLERSPASCAERLGEAAEALARGAARVEEAVQAGQCPQPFEDDLSDLLERAYEAALLASRDPVGAAHTASEARPALERLDERVRRSLELGRGAATLRDRLAQLPAPASTPGPADLPALIGWAWHLADEVVHDLDEGARDEATRELDRALGLVKDAELLAKGALGRPEAELELLRDELHQARLAVDEMRREFAPESWEDAEVAMLRAAARIELLDQRLAAGGRVPRLAARLSSVRAATLLCTTRLLSLRGERERALGLLEVLEGRARAVDGYLERERPAVTDATRAAWAAAKQELRLVEAVARDEGRPAAWDRVLVDLGAVEDAFDRVRARAGEEALRLRRVVALAQGLEKAVREAEDVVRRVNPGSAGAPLRLDAARRALDVARKALARVAEGAPAPSGEGAASASGEAPAAAADAAGDLRALIPTLQAGLRACRDARELAAPRVLRLGLGEGVAGDARHALLLARAAHARAHRAFVHGVIADPVELRRGIDDAEAALAIDPAAALSQACDLVARGDELAAAALGREQAASEASAEARAVEASEAARVRHELLRRARRDELHRRTRFEVLVLGEAEDPQAEGEDIDAGDPDEELAALEEVAGDREAASAAAAAAFDDPPPAPAAAESPAPVAEGTAPAPAAEGTAPTAEAAAPTAESPAPAPTAESPAPAPAAEGAAPAPGAEGAAPAAEGATPTA